MAQPRRRAALCLPALLLPGLAARAGARVPPFADWVGRTARLRGDSGLARLLLARDGTGFLSVRLLFLCRPLPVFAWRIEQGGTLLTYDRQSALVRDRVIHGRARILPSGDAVEWIEATDHIAEFEGFEPAAAVHACG
jgi:hypothetical protein